MSEATTMARLMIVLFPLLVGGAGVVAFSAKVVIGGIFLASLAVFLIALMTTSMRRA